MIEFTRAAYDEVVAHAKAGAPEEICGVLAGEHGSQTSRVEAVHRTANAADAPRTTYEIGPEELLATVEAVEDAGQEVVGFYHSHPAGPSVPSETDRAQATWQGYSYVIVALDGTPFVGSWRWNRQAERFEQETVRVVRD